MLTVETSMIVTIACGAGLFVAGMCIGWLLAKASRRPASASPGKVSKEGSVEIYVGNLSYDVSDKDLGVSFAEFGKVLSARIIKNRSNGKSKGYGFVQMAERAESHAAIKSLNGKELKGRRIVVNEAKSPPRG